MLCGCDGIEGVGYRSTGTYGAGVGVGPVVVNEAVRREVTVLSAKYTSPLSESKTDQAGLLMKAEKPLPLKLTGAPYPAMGFAAPASVTVQISPSVASAT